MSSTNTYHTGLSNRVGEQNQEDTENCSNPDGQTAWLALQQKTKIPPPKKNKNKNTKQKHKKMI